MDLPRQNLASSDARLFEVHDNKIGYCAKCRREHDWSLYRSRGTAGGPLSEFDARGRLAPGNFCSPPISVTHFGNRAALPDGSRIPVLHMDPEYRAALFDHCPLYTTKEVVGSYYGEDGAFPSHARHRMLRSGAGRPRDQHEQRAANGVDLLAIQARASEFLRLQVRAPEALLELAGGIAKEIARECRATLNRDHHATAILGDKCRLLGLMRARAGLVEEIRRAKLVAEVGGLRHCRGGENPFGWHEIVGELVHQPIWWGVLAQALQQHSLVLTSYHIGDDPDKTEYEERKTWAGCSEWPGVGVADCPGGCRFNHIALYVEFREG